EKNKQLAISNRQKAEEDEKQMAISEMQKKLGTNTNTLDIVNLIKSKIQNPMLRPAASHPDATAQQPSKILLVDGGLMNIRMWARIKYKKTIPVVEEALEDDVTDLYLLCRPVNEWEPDTFREAPLIIDRVWIYNQYLDELSKSNRSVEI